MKVIDTQTLAGTERAVKFPGGISLRAVLEHDKMGFSVNRTIIPKGKPQRWHYLNHLEACYCVSGSAMLTDKKTGNSYNIIPGVVYILDKHDDHIFQAFEETVLVSIFNPPLTGMETHDSSGSYNISETMLSRYHLAKEIVEAVKNSANDLDAVEEITELLTQKHYV